MKITKLSLDGGKYTIVRDEHNRITEMFRHGEPWESGLKTFQFAGVFHAALNEIDRLTELLNKEKTSP